MAEDQGRQLGEDDGTPRPKREGHNLIVPEDLGRQHGEDNDTVHATTPSVLTLRNPQASPANSPHTVTTTTSRTRTATASANKKPGYCSRELEDLPRPQRRRIEQEIQKGRKPGLTIDNVRKALHGIHWREVGVMLRIPYSKLHEIEREYPSDEEREVAVIRYWILRDPFASWRKIIERLEWTGRHDRAITLHHYSEELTDFSLNHNNLAAVLETVKVDELEACLSVPFSMWEKLRQQCDNDEERRNELISWWLQSSPYALDSWKWLSSQLFWLKEKSALAAAKRYIHQTPDPTLTLNNVTAIMKDVRRWDSVADWIGIPYSKRSELRRQNPATDQCKQAFWDYSGTSHNGPSQERPPTI